MFEYDTPGVEFFIILDGKVGVYKPIAKEEEAREKTILVRKEKIANTSNNSNVPRVKSNYAGINI